MINLINLVGEKAKDKTIFDTKQKANRNFS